LELPVHINEFLCILYQLSLKFKYATPTASARVACSLGCELKEQNSNCPHVVFVKKAWMASLTMFCDDWHDRAGLVALTLQVAIEIIKWLWRKCSFLKFNVYFVILIVYSVFFLLFSLHGYAWVTMKFVFVYAVIFPFKLWQSALKRLASHFLCIQQ
jgi:hypothetical protein